MKKLGLVFWAMAFAAFAPYSAAAADAGSCESKAKDIKVGGSANVKLVNEWDPDSKEYWDAGGYYLKVTLARGTSYTVWIDSGDFADLSLSAYARPTTEAEDEKEIWGPSADFGAPEEYKTATAVFLDKADSDPEDPTSWLYYIYVAGDIGQTCTVHIEQGLKSFRPEGVEDNPLKLTVKNDLTTISKNFTDEGGYYMTASLKKDRKYLFMTQGGTAESPRYMDVSYAKEVEHFIDADPRYVADTNNTSVVIVPVEDDVFTFYVDGPGTAFKMAYRSVPARAVASHPNIEALKDGDVRNFIPGRLCADADYYDSIIDERLFSIAAAKGSRWVATATGAESEIRMVVYDAKGNTLMSNTDSGAGNFDVRASFEAPAAATYYVGVCNPALDYTNEVVGAEVTLTIESISAQDGDPDEYDATDDTYAGANMLSPLPDGIRPFASHGPHLLSKTDWCDTFVIAGRKGVTYEISSEWATEETGYLNFKAEVFKINSSKKETAVTLVDGTGIFSPGADSISFTATANENYYIRISVAEGKGLEFPAYNLISTASLDKEGLYCLTVDTKGTDGQWSIGSEKTLYPNGASILVAGTQTVRFSSVKGFSTPTNMLTSVSESGFVTLTGIYSDTADHKDDVVSGAVRIKPAYKVATAKRTLWEDDPADHFVFAAEANVYYSFALEDLEGDAEMTIFKAGDETEILAGPATEIPAFSAAKGDYIVKVTHPVGASNPDAQYVLRYGSVQAGIVSFAKTAVTAKKTAGAVKLTVKRSKKEGSVRVRYGTVCGDAQPGVDYVAQQGELFWKDGDNKDKTITIKLIPELFADETLSRTFSVRIEPLALDDVADGEYQAFVTKGEAVVTVTETAAKPGSAIKPTVVKQSEAVALETGTYQGVIAESGMGAGSGFGALASVSFTATTKATKALSAKVTVAGKSYSFAADTWNEAESDAENAVAAFADKSGNTLRITVRRGDSKVAGEWMKASANVELFMKSIGEREYDGEIFRSNAKIQDYFYAVTNVVGYYTVALVPAGVSPADGIPAGNGYLSLTVDVKGKAKVAGLLADGKTKVSYTSEIAIRDDGASVYVPVFSAKSPYCFGGVIRMARNAEGRYVVASDQLLIWNNDNAALTADGVEGWRIDINPTGGYFGKTENLQAYYLTSAFSVSTIDVSEFRPEALAKGYEYVYDVKPTDAVVSVLGNTVSSEKRVLKKDGKVYDFESSVNPCNLQIKFARATGIVSGSFSLWSEDATGKQKEVTGLKHYGIMILSRDEASPLDLDVMSAGFFTQSVKLTEGKKTRAYTASMPFNLLAADQGEPDWYADDWGERSEEE